MNQDKLMKLIKQRPYTVDAIVKLCSDVTKSKIAKQLNKLVNYNLLVKMKLFFNHKHRSVYLHPDLTYFVCSYNLDNNNYLLCFKDMQIKKLQTYLVSCYILIDDEWHYLGREVAVDINKMWW